MTTEALTDSADNQRSVNDEQTAHLAGFFDAAGNIAIRVVKDSDYRLNYNLEPRLTISRGDGDDPSMGKLIDYCEQNGIRYGLSRESHGKNAETESLSVIIKEPDSIERFLEPMLEYLVTEYERATVMLDVVLPAFRDEKHREKESFVQLVEIADDLREVGTKVRGSGVKYTSDFFREEWSLPE